VHVQKYEMNTVGNFVGAFTGTGPNGSIACTWDASTCEWNGSGSGVDPLTGQGFNGTVTIEWGGYAWWAHTTGCPTNGSASAGPYLSYEEHNGGEDCSLSRSNGYIHNFGNGKSFFDSQDTNCDGIWYNTTSGQNEDLGFIQVT